VWWAKEDDEGKGGSWWDGRIKLIRPTSSEFPDSPWESFHVTYKESSEPTPHSPWELFDKECKISGYNIPQIDPSLKDSLLSIIRSMTDNSCQEVCCPSFHLPHGWHKISQSLWLFVSVGHMVVVGMLLLPFLLYFSY
jgi:hypothetical protein